MSDPSERTLRLLSLLQSHRHWPGSLLAARLGVSARTVRRDVERLRALGYPVRAAPGVDGGYQLTPGASLPPLVLDDDEAVALTVGLQLVAQTSVEGVAEASARALAKVSQVLPARLVPTVRALSSATESAPLAPAGHTVDPAVLTALAAACRDEERVRLTYTAADSARTERTVDPYRVVRLGSRWYLVAYDLTRRGWRTLRLDRITAPVPTGDRALARALPDGSDAAGYVRASIGAAPRPYDVAARVAADPGEVRRRVGRWMQVEADGSQARVRAQTDSLSWAAFGLLEAGGAVSEVEPAELRDLLGRWAERLAAGRPDLRDGGSRR